MHRRRYALDRVRAGKVSLDDDDDDDDDDDFFGMAKTSISEFLNTLSVPLKLTAGSSLGLFPAPFRIHSEMR